jgi:hypothetical protein
VKEEIVAGLVVVAVVACVGWLWARKGVPRNWFGQELAAADASQVADDAAQVQVLREQVLEVAREQGVVLPARATGRNPTVVTFSDESQSFFFTDFSAYQREMQAGRVPPRRSFARTAPVPVTTWSREQLEAWLSEHAA